MERKIPGRYEQFVITDFPRFMEMSGHNRPAPSWIYPDTFPGVNIRINGNDVSKMVRSPHAESHIHDDHPEIYFAATANRGDIVIEVQMGKRDFHFGIAFCSVYPPGGEALLHRAEMPFT